jgi:hypothetical protein
VFEMDMSVCGSRVEQFQHNLRTLSFRNMGFEALRQSVLAWDIAGTSFELPAAVEFPPNRSTQECQAVIQQLVAAGACPGMAHPTPLVVRVGDACEHVLDALLEFDFVSCHRRAHDTSEWFLSAHAYAQVRICTQLHKPRYLFRHRSLEPLQSLTTFELFEKLLSGGWQHFVLGKRAQAKNSPVTPLDADNVVYSCGSRISHAYLLALASSSTIFAAGFVTEIIHEGCAQHPSTCSSVVLVAQASLTIFECISNRNSVSHKLPAHHTLHASTGQAQ